MGTRADFYIKSGKKLTWLGSIGWDGYPSGVDFGVLYSKTKEEFTSELEKFFSKRDDVTLPKDGWPWPWEDSRTTDYAYIFDKDTVYASSYGSNLVNAIEAKSMASLVSSAHHVLRTLENKDPLKEPLVKYTLNLDQKKESFWKQSKKKVSFPDMASVKKVALDNRSGLIIIGGNRS